MRIAAERNHPMGIDSKRERGSKGAEKGRVKSFRKHSERDLEKESISRRRDIILAEKG